MNFCPLVIQKILVKIFHIVDLMIPNRPNFVCLPAKNRFSNFKKTRFFAFFGNFLRVFSSKCDFCPKVPRKCSKCFLLDSPHPKDHFYAFLSNFRQFKILKFLTFSWLKNGCKSSSVLSWIWLNIVKITFLSKAFLRCKIRFSLFYWKNRVEWISITPWGPSRKRL